MMGAEYIGNGYNNSASPTGGVCPAAVCPLDGGCGAVSYNKENSYHAKGCFKIKGVLEQQIIRFAIETMQAKK